MISLTKQYRTIGGNEVDLRGVRSSGTYPIEGLYLSKKTNKWLYCTWTEEGKYWVDQSEYNYDPEDKLLDLVEV